MGIRKLLETTTLRKTLQIIVRLQMMSEVTPKAVSNERKSITPDGLEQMRVYTLSRRRRRVQTMIAMFIAVTLGALGDVSLSKGMKMIDETPFQGIFQGAVATFTNYYVILGIALLICFLLLYLASLSWEDLSFVLPLTAADYVLVTIFAFFLLHEDVTPLRWAGSVLVAAGIAVVTRT